MLAATAHGQSALNNWQSRIWRELFEKFGQLGLATGILDVNIRPRVRLFLKSGRKVSGWLYQAIDGSITLSRGKKQIKSRINIDFAEVVAIEFLVQK